MRNQTKINIVDGAQAITRGAVMGLMIHSTANHLNKAAVEKNGRWMVATGVAGLIGMVQSVNIVDNAFGAFKMTKRYKNWVENPDDGTSFREDLATVRAKIRAMRKSQGVEMTDEMAQAVEDICTDFSKSAGSNVLLIEDASRKAA